MLVDTQIKQNIVNPIFPFDQLEAKGHRFAKPTKWKTFELKDGTVVINNIRTIRRSRHIDDVYGYDTETYRGTCRLLCCSDGSIKSLLKPSFKECLDFLFINASRNNAYRFFYNIDFDYNAILKLYNEYEPSRTEIIRRLDKGMEYEINGYRISYIKGVMLTLRKGRKKVVITDLFRIFKMSLNSASIEFLKNEQKNVIDGERLNVSLSYWKRNEKNIIDYCVQDCLLLKKLGLIFLEHLEKAEIEKPLYLCSPASLSKQHFRKKSWIPSISEIPKEILQIGYDAYYGGRFEIIRKGTFDKLYNYDVNSEYPEIIAKLPSFKYGLWIYYDNLEKLPDKECFGYFYAELRIPDWNLISTIPVRYKGMIRFPNGIHEGWYTWYDLDLMREFIREIKECYIYEKSKSEYLPFDYEIKHIYKKKAEYKNKNKIMYMIFKLTMNALYGCFYEIHDNEQSDGSIERTTGILFNPVNASMITAFGRWKILKDVWNVRDNLVGFHTDSILSEIPLENYLDIGDGLGKWNLEAKGKGFIINTGMYQINDVVKGKYIRTRGVPLKYIGDWFEFAEKNKNLSSKEFKIYRMVKLGQALREYKNLDMVNIMKDNKKTININSDKKRTWFKSFDDFNEVLTSNVGSLPLIYYSENMIPNPMFM